MRWLFQKGDALPVNKPKRAAIECSVQFKLDETRTCGSQLAICRDDDAPLRYMDDGMLLHIPLDKSADSLLQPSLHSAQCVQIYPLSRLVNSQGQGRDLVGRNFWLLVFPLSYWLI